jgi:hypothetical protein
MRDIGDIGVHDVRQVVDFDRDGDRRAVRRQLDVGRAERRAQLLCGSDRFDEIGRRGPLA